MVETIKFKANTKLKIINNDSFISEIHSYMISVGWKFWKDNNMITPTKEDIKDCIYDLVWRTELEMYDNNLLHNCGKSGNFKCFVQVEGDYVVEFEKSF